MKRLSRFSLAAFRGFSASKPVLPLGLQQRFFWDHVKMGPPDPILGVTQAFQKDTSTAKINLGVGAYRDDNNKPYVLPVVREAEKRLYEEKRDHEYGPIGGPAPFPDLAAKLILGEDSKPIREGLNVTVQSISGTGACRIGTEFLGRFAADKAIYLPDPTWANHIPLCTDAGLKVKYYRYYDSATNTFNEKGFLEDLSKAPSGQIFLLHACAHNPTGFDPSPETWTKASAICKERGHIVFFDSAYQGFASGDPDKDAFPVRKFVSDGHKVLIAQSFAKNFGLYGERVGAFTIIAKDKNEKEILDSQLKILIRPLYSNPPIYGSRLVSIILGDKQLTAQW
eukprot:TRINITY_DN5657_c0_g1_i4.p1 TRINITY_DN5657_c0_g1~~TRINITY_DN5657_c0_g1_i4.p1  ORF type:complete len:339 (-),score=86.06 TRINITY_DN5657_c0_g1_i4:28-1044(-)